MPAPTAWTIRKLISVPTDHEIAHMSDPSVKIVIPMRKNRLRPNWSASRPIDTSRTANVMLYALSTHETVLTGACRSRWSWGIEMLTIVMSIRAMKRPIITTPQIRQRLA